MHAVEIVKAHIFRRETGIEQHQTASKNPVLFLPKLKTESEIEQKLQTVIVTKTENSKLFGTKTEKY